jgi:hypothetical protein
MELIKTLYLLYFIPIVVAIAISGELPTGSAATTLAVTTLHFFGGAYELSQGRTSLRGRYTGQDADGFTVSTRGQVVSNVVADVVILSAWVVALVCVAGEDALALTAALLALAGNVFCYAGRS